MSLSVENPGAVQHVAEMTHEFVSEQGEQIIGHGYERFTSYLTVLLLFILLCESAGVAVAVAGVAYGERCGAAGVGAGDVCVLPLPWHAGEWLCVYQAVPGTGVVAVSVAAAD